MNNTDRVIVWRITQNCNMNCLFYSYGNEVQRRRDVADIADIERFIEVLGTHKKKAGQEILVSWIGGEPFLCDNYSFIESIV